MDLMHCKHAEKQAVGRPGGQNEDSKSDIQKEK